MEEARCYFISQKYLTIAQVYTIEVNIFAWLLIDQGQDDASPHIQASNQTITITITIIVAIMSDNAAFLPGRDCCFERLKLQLRFES